MRIESGPTSERRNRALIMPLLMLGMGGWFGYDGWVTYPKTNLDDMRRTLPAEAKGEVRIDERVVETMNEKTAAELKAELGEPPVVAGDDVRYFGRAGYLTAKSSGGKATWSRVKYSTTDILLQRGLGVGLVAIGLGMLFQFVRLLGQRVIVDDSGLKITGRGARTVGWDQMRELRSGAYQEKGWVELVYQADGRDQQVRLDSYDIEHFDPIIEEVCRRKGFKSPLTKAAPAA